MVDSQTHPHFINPWVLHLQKLGLELKCPFCLNLYHKPLLLPCNHIFCSTCVPKSNSFGSECPLCKLSFVERELRQAPYMENLVNIYRSLDASFSMHMLSPDNGSVSERCLYSAKMNFPGQLVKQGSSSPGNSTSEPFNILLTGTKRVQVWNNSLPINKMEKLAHFGNSGVRNGTTEQDFQTCCMSSVNNLHQTIAKENECEAVNADMNEVELSPDSPPSIGVSKGVEVDGCDLGNSDDTAEKCSLKKSAKRDIDDFGAQGTSEHPGLCLKKQKQLYQGLPEMHGGHLLSSMSMNLQNSISAGSDINPKHLQNSISTGCDTDPKSKISSSDQLAVEFDATSLVNFTCAFCQTWKVTEESGPMQHFVNGKQVFGSDAGCSNVIHVHKSCIEWAPQTFYESETVVKNLEKELARAAKLKCTSCGLKGAALGCYAKSCRRSYHVTCAYGIEHCRWDSDEYLMLCPSHNSLKFPSEKLRKSAPKKCTTAALTYVEQKSLHDSDFWASSPNGAEKWVFCGSALSADEKFMLVKFAKLCGATVTKVWNPNVTHVIAATDASGACSRTLKVLMAILRGKWILKTDWVGACMQSKCPVDEEPYEINLDNHGCSNGPKIGRLRALNNAPLLFSDFKFLFTGDFIPSYKNDIQNLIRAAGGTIFESREQLQQCLGTKSTLSTRFIIYNNDAVMGVEDASEVSQRQLEAERLAVESQSQVIAHTWILDSISSSALQPFSSR